jgi:diguanylate cyclase (GGDEF)-like protein
LGSSWTVGTRILWPLAALAVVAIAGAVSGGDLTPYLVLLPLAFVFAGFTQPTGTSVLLAVPAVVALVIGARGELDRELVVTIVLAVPVSVVAGEAVARLTRRQRDAEDRVGRLLQAVRVLAREEDERHGAQALSALAVDLLGADAAAVLLARDANTRLFQSRGWFGHPALADAVPWVISADELQAYVAVDEPTFHVDATAVPLLAGAGHAARSVLVVPLLGERGPVGVLLALWGQRRSALPSSALQAGALLAQETGRMLSRLHATAALTRDAETDPLTQLANRRTYGRALATLQADDAVVIVDLDHFKRVNDRYGHDEGDRALRSLAQCLQQVSRQVDCVARYGGEEFALVLADAGLDGARAALGRLRDAWAATGPVTTFSAGVAVHDGVSSPEETLQRADVALYRAKEHGRNRDEFAAAGEIALP